MNNNCENVKSFWIDGNKYVSISSNKLLFILVSFFLSHATGYCAEAPWVGVSLDGKPCPVESRHGYGPFDYTVPEYRAKNLPIVENYHFTDDVRLLIKGKSGYIPDDLNYTLVAFPNHIKALNSVMYYEKLLVTDKSKDKRLLLSPVECYFQRAINFSPKDAVAHALYAVYLKSRGKAKEADHFYRIAIELSPEQMMIRHSYGVFLAKQKKYDEAMEQASIIYKKNFSDQKLKKILISKGLWK
jgi:tetratricopeptide (TPR) repeat protein